jgi:Tol biopolymer transport system component
MGWDPQDSLNQGIYFSRWEKGRWSPPQPVPFNTEWQEFDPAVTPDGRWLYFCSDRPGGIGGADVWRVALRRERFGEPENLGPVLNSRGDDWGPSFSADGRVMVLSSDGRGGAGKHDLFRSVWTGTEWAAPANLGRQVNSPEDDIDPCVVGKLERVIFASNRPGGYGGFDLWETTPEDHASGAWQPARPLAPPLNSQSWDSCPYLAPSGKAFYFSSTRRTGSPVGADIYLVVAK